MYIVCFCFKQKTAYGMRISGGSSNVCSSDLTTRFWHKAACTGGTLVEPARLTRESSENSKPESTAHSRPVVAPLARSKCGVTSTRPMLTNATNKIGREHV